MFYVFSFPPGVYVGTSIASPSILTLISRWLFRDNSENAITDWDDTCRGTIFYVSFRSVDMGKPTICLDENKGADKLRSDCEADQRLCFRYSDSTIPLLLKFEISRFCLFSVTVHAGLCRTCSETTLLVFPRGGSFVAITKTCPCNIQRFL